MTKLVEMATVENLILRAYVSEHQKTAGELIEYLKRKTQGSQERGKGTEKGQA